MKKILFPYFCAFSVLISSCGDLTEVTNPSQKLTVLVYGIYDVPDGAAGNAAPQFYELSFSSLSLTNEDGDVVDFSPTETETLRVIDRPQIVYEKDIEDYAGDSFTAASISFDPSVVVGGKYRSDYSLVLNESTVTRSESFSVEKSKGLKLSVKISWQDTVFRDAGQLTEEIMQPDLEMTIESD